MGARKNSGHGGQNGHPVDTLVDRKNGKRLYFWVQSLFFAVMFGSKYIDFIWKKEGWMKKLRDKRKNDGKRCVEVKVWLF